MNRAKRVLIGLALVMVCGFFVWEFSRARDPFIRGHRLSSWLIVLSKNPEGTSSYNAAVEAIREAGTNGLPLMVHMLQRQDTSASQLAAWVLRKQHVVHAKWTMAWDVRLAALRGLKLLGPEAEPVAPTLGELMCVTNVTMEATLALLQMGRPALREFHNALTNQEPTVRNWATVGIRQLHNDPIVGWGTKAEDAAWDKVLVRPLLLLLTDNQARDGARGALLAIIRTDRDTAIPEIAEGLKNPNRDVSEQAAKLLALATPFQSPTTR